MEGRTDGIVASVVGRMAMAIVLVKEVAAGGYDNGGEHGNRLSRDYAPPSPH